MKDNEQLSETKKRLLELMLKKKRQEKKDSKDKEIKGEVIITPPQAEEFAIHNPDRHIFNISLLVEVEQKIPRTLLETLLQTIVNHHDGLRLCSIEENNSWRQFISPPTEEIPLVYYDYSHLPREKKRQTIEEQTVLVQKSFDLATGPLVKAAYFDFGENTPDRLMFIVHHTGCDHYSIMILLEDTITVLNQITTGNKIQLPEKTTSIQKWARKLQDLSCMDHIKDELPYWLNEKRKAVKPLPLDYPDQVNLGKYTVTYHQTLKTGHDSSLASHVLTRQDLQIHHVVIAAAAMALINWTGGSSSHISLCHHGRNHTFKDIDISRTVGWFSYQYPLLIDLEGCEDVKKILNTVKEQVDTVPAQGLHYGVLRYLAQDEVRRQFEDYPEPQLFLNIRVGSSLLQLPGFKLAREDMGPNASQTIIRPRYLYLNVDIENEKIAFNLAYNSNIHNKKSIEKFIDNYIHHMSTLEEII